VLNERSRRLWVAAQARSFAWVLSDQTQPGHIETRVILRRARSWDSAKPEDTGNPRLKPALYAHQLSNSGQRSPVESAVCRLATW
jgi:hypothetical protein